MSVFDLNSLRKMNEITESSSGVIFDNGSGRSVQIGSVDSDGYAWVDLWNDSHSCVGRISARELYEWLGKQLEKVE